MHIIGESLIGQFGTFDKKMKLFSFSPRMRQLALLVLVLVSAMIAVTAYLQAIDYPFISDDFNYTNNNIKLERLHPANLWRLFVEPYNPIEFLPLRDFSYWLDMALFGMNRSVFRIHNIILYLLCLPLVYATTLRLWRYFRPMDAASATWAAAVVTALFALHPSHVEAVVWISSRKDVLSGMFSLLALWLAVNARREQVLSAPHATAALVALLAAMFSKATAVAVAPVIALLWVIFWRDIPAPDRRRSLLLWPLASLLLAACAALIFMAYSTIKEPAYFGIETVTRMLAVLGWLARLSISPEGRHFFYQVFEDTKLPAMVVLGAFILMAAVTGVVMMLRKRTLEGFAWVTFLLLCLPYTQLIPFNTFSLVSDRFLTLAVWPVVLLIVALSWRLSPVPRTAMLFVIALPWGFQTIERPRDWYSNEVLIDTDLRAYPGHYLPAFFRIRDLLAGGEYREASDIASSITDPEIRDILAELIHADHAVSIDAVLTGKPTEAMTNLWNLGLKLKQWPVQARWNSSMSHVLGESKNKLATEWETLASRFPFDMSVRYNAGLWLLRMDFKEKKAVADSVAYLRAATGSQRLPEPVRGTAFKNLGLALMKSGQVAEAEAPLRAALEQPQPDLRAHCLLSKVYQQTKRFEEAAHAEAECRKQPPSEGAAQ